MSTKRRMSYYDNFLKKYPSAGKSDMDAAKFSEIWQHYDSNNSGYIDDEGLDKFFKDLLMTMSSNEVTPELVKDLKDCFMESYDDAKDGRIAITELANILPTDENFILLFRREENLQSSVELMTLWKKYDKNKSGYITRHELGDFIRDLLAQRGKKLVPEEKIKEYVKAMLKIFDKNNDGHLSLAEMARLLAIKTEENFLITSSRMVKFQDLSPKERNARLNEVFDHYDKGKTNYLEGAEIDLFVKDLLDYGGLNEGDDFQQDSMRKVQIFKQTLMQHCDIDGDGKLSKGEVKMCIGIHE
ncbi:secretagogin-like isoform X1 [Asterias rubens]|uniref:secretagogin-like isoform X1 n=1 Tax=Asterias rubens TaxID=7604 RepID=UPI001455CDC1|nr:secretagogin-like isoform X1 [Asterias rubens]